MPPLQTRQASIAVQNGQEFFRLFQEFESAGDIFEIDTSIKAVSVGPQSDVANYKLDFFDDQADNNIDEVNIAAGTPFIGRLDARLASIYPTTGLAARIIVSARDLIDNTFLPTTFSAGAGDIVAARPPPQIDLVAFLSNPPAISSLRDDRQYFFPFNQLAAGGSGSSGYYILPYYGRRYGHISFVNRNAAGAIYTITVVGINLSEGATVSAPANRNKASETTLGTLTAGSGVTDDEIISDANGLFDLLSIRVNRGANGVANDFDTTLRVTVSDRRG